MLLVEQGSPVPFGLAPEADAVNFAIFSRHATKMSVLIYAKPQDKEPMHELVFDPKLHKTGDVWHMRVKGLTLPIYYHYCCGDNATTAQPGNCFNWEHRLIDPYAQAITAEGHWGLNPQDLPKAIFYPQDFDWEGDMPLNYPLKDCVIYETHVRGFSKLTGLHSAGTYKGIVGMIPYLKDLGITSLELLPVFEFDSYENTLRDPTSGAALTNYWGYSTICFFAPKVGFSSDKSPAGQIGEFKYMVRELHKAGIEVILDVVFNHTGEGNHMGPVYNFKGLDNQIYYMLCNDKKYYSNYSGCGNTLNANHPVVKNFILDCLRYWVTHMHVDGFRFDLATAMCRDDAGNILRNPPLFRDMSEDPILANTKMIVEPWDAEGGYLVGSFPYHSFSEWNDQFRDTVRGYWRNDPHKVGHFATVLGGSNYLYETADKTPHYSINYVTCHDGFTLRDLVSYQQKHNLRNGQDNRDGTDNHVSWNCGVEGPTDNVEIQNLRKKQMKNFMFTVAISKGVPMFNGGDEFCRTQYGNNNAYCQDNEISWYDYHLLQENPGMKRFFVEIIAMRRFSHSFCKEHFFTGRSDGIHPFPDIQWYSNTGTPFDWGSADNSFACCIATGITKGEYETWVFFFNPTARKLQFTIPTVLPGYVWKLKADTAKESPMDISARGHFYSLEKTDFYTVEGHSMVCLYMMRDD